MPNPRSNRAPHNLKLYVNTISLDRQKLYFKMILVAVERYLNWYEKNVTGIIRFSHFFHGSSGKERAIKLKKYLNTTIGIHLAQNCIPEYITNSYSDDYFRFNIHPKRQTFYNSIDLITSMFEGSGYCNHSLRTFLIRQMNNGAYIDYSVKEASKKLITTYLSEFEEPDSYTNQSPLENFNFWCMADLIQKKSFLDHSGKSAENGPLKDYLSAIHKTDMEEIKRRVRLDEIDHFHTNFGYIM